MFCMFLFMISYSGFEIYPVSILILNTDLVLIKRIEAYFIDIWNFKIILVFYK